MTVALDQGYTDNHSSSCFPSLYAFRGELRCFLPGLHVHLSRLWRWNLGFGVDGRSQECRRSLWAKWGKISQIDMNCSNLQLQPSVLLHEEVLSNLPTGQIRLGDIIPVVKIRRRTNLFAERDETKNFSWYLRKWMAWSSLVPNTKSGSTHFEVDL